MTPSIDTIQGLLVNSAFVIPIITGIVEVIKRALKISGDNTRWIPLIAVLTGLVFGLFLIQMTVIGATVGIIFGLGSVGLWEVGSKTIAGK